MLDVFMYKEIMFEHFGTPAALHCISRFDRLQMNAPPVFLVSKLLETSLVIDQVSCRSAKHQIQRMKVGLDKDSKPMVKRIPNLKRIKSSDELGIDNDDGTPLE